MKNSSMMITIMVLAFGLLVSCKKDEKITDSEPAREFQVRMDSVKLAKNVSRNDTLRASLWGIIGTTTCYRFSRYESVRDSFEVRVKVFGRYTPSSVCSPAIVQLRQATYYIYPIYPGKFTIYILQPDGSVLRDTSLVL